jgi:NitT/TauT family transport system permease protein
VSDGEFGTSARRWVGRALAKSYSIVAVLLLWEILARVLDNVVFLPGVGTVLKALGELAHSGELSADLASSTWRALCGFFIASAVGIPLGLAMGSFARMDDFWGSLISLSFPIPKIGLIPLFILWLGIGDTSKIAVIVAGAIYPVIMNTYSGVKGTPRYLVWSAQTLGAGTFEVLSRVILPHTLPFIFAGLRLAMGIAWILLFAAEMVAATSGLGFRILYAQRLLDTPVVFASLVMIAVLGFAFDRLLYYLSRYACDWYFHRNV